MGILPAKKKFPTGSLLEHGVSKDGVGILLEMMNPYPADRITATEALSRPWSCVQKLETAVFTHPNIEKGLFETVTDQSHDGKLQIADWTGQVNASTSFNTYQGHSEMGEPTPAPAIPFTTMNVYLTDRRNKTPVNVADPQNNDDAIAHSTTITQS